MFLPKIDSATAIYSIRLQAFDVLVFGILCVNAEERLQNVNLYMCPLPCYRTISVKPK